ncbi:GNAT family N-acetyltransferase [Aliikangiella coralliicola]|uniref:GNAT family N-acetyltransferase n=1 Tax=Aliikangiella coralliicola TaxID=2592383 RepID=A0A545UE57_9GAMM|nr:GNAT family N-acetyltransferase [Aliikangiella coralliicola]TQV87738.1 GNAT family N-acetyltransferase [Aliikangiella coralliicola]
MSLEIQLRNAVDADIPFLLSLRNATMNDYLEEAGIPTDEKSHLIRIQYRFDDAQIVCHADKPIGLFKYYVDDNGWHVTQIQILPTYQGNGIGATLIKNLQQQASEKQSTVTLGVLKSNPALRLYQKLGFIIIDENDEEFLMRYESVTD